MATAIETETGSDEYKDVKCAICASKNKKKISADYCCFDCKKHLCKSCLEYHNEFNVSHNVVPGHGDDKDVLTEKCKDHVKELITLYCRQHDKLMCRKCRRSNHRTCQEPQNIRDSSDELNADPELQAVPAQLKSALDDVNKAIQFLKDQHIASIQQSGNSFLEDLEDYTKKLISRIKELREKGRRDIKRKQEELLSVAEQHLQKCDVTKEEINQCYDKITKSNEWKANIFVFKKTGQTLVQNADALLKESDSLIKNCHINFMTNKTILDSLNDFDYIVSTKESPDGKALYRKQVRKTNVRTTVDESSCGINGCCDLSDGSVVISDDNNKRLKFVDHISRRVTKYCEISRRPTSLCGIGPQEVAVAFGSSNVHVYNAMSLNKIRTIELDHKTNSIASHGGRLYAGSRNRTLDVHDVSDGRKLFKIRKADDRALFSDIRRIALNGPMERIYVADYDRGLVCVSTDGQLIFRLSEDELGLNGAQGVTIDHRGHVFVCGYVSNNVVEVTGDGHVLGQILTAEDGIEDPYCLCFDGRMSRLYVGGEYMDQLLMVDLEPV